MDNIVYKPHASLHFTKGVLRSLIVDTQRRSYEAIPNDMYDLLISLKSAPLTFSELTKDCGRGDCKVIENYLNWLIDREYIFKCDRSLFHAFENVKFEVDQASELDNAILDYDSSSNYSLSDVLVELDSLNCKSLHVRAYDVEASYRVLSAILAIKKSILLNIHVLVCYSGSYLTEILKTRELVRVNSIVIHSCKKSDERHLAMHAFGRNMNSEGIVCVEKEILNATCCGEVNRAYFSPTYKCLSLSKGKNTCLYRKIGVDVQGNIKNCPTLNKSYGKVGDTNISSILNLSDYKELGLITKSKIKVCSDCEFRSICTDCRAILSVAGDIYSKPKKCKYDPYTATYEE